MDGAGARSREGPNALAVARPSARAIAALGLSALESKLSIRKQARRDGAQNIPAPDAEDLSETERAILDAIAQQRAALHDERDRLRADLEQKMRALRKPVPDFSALVLEASLAIKQNVARAEPEARAAAQSARGAKADLDAFRLRNDLHRQAIYADAPMLQAGLLFLAAMAEAAFSAALFAEDDDRGLLGGAITAIGLSGANVVLGFLAGFVGLRYLQHCKRLIKTAGLAAFAAFGFLALLLNLFAADWRDRLAAAKDAEPITPDASFHLYALLNLNTPQAIILLMLGAGVWVFAAWKGYASFDDPYPDYGKLARAASKARDEHGLTRDDALDDIETHVRALREAVGERQDEARANAAQIADAFDDGARRIAIIDARERDLGELAIAALVLYREENLAARSTPTPAYFAKAPPLPAPPEDALTTAASMLDEARATLAACEKAVAAALTDVNTAYEAALARLDGGADA